MKQTLLSILLMLLPIVASADAVEIGGIYYNLVDKVKTAEVTSNPSRYKGGVVIPSSVVYGASTYSVTSIGSSAFSNCSGLTSVTIPNSVTSIGSSAFSWCSGLTSVTIPNSVTSIGSSAFSWCSGLTSVTIPNSVKSIGSEAFRRSGLTSVTIPNSVTSIGSSAFSGCSGLTSVTIPNSVASIGGSAFSGCSGLTSVTIPNSVTSIGWDAFLGCSGLTSVTIPNSVTSIGSSAFDGCIKLTSVTIESGIKTISGNAFANCPELRAVYCHAEQVPNTSSNAFEGSYPNYIMLYVPESSIDSYKSTVPWNGFQSVKSIESAEGTDPDINLSGTVQIGGIYYNLVDKVKTAEVTSNPNKYKGGVVIPSSVVYGASTYSVTSIGSSAFSWCSGLTSVTIPNSVTSIGSEAFSWCSGLTSVTIPNSVKSIGSEAFSWCSGLTSVTIPNSVKSIGSSAFSSCSGLTSVTIPNSVTSIGSSAFHGCSGLTSVTIPNSVASIGGSAFSGCSGLTSVTIPNSVTSIGWDAFLGCSGLTSVTIPNSVTSIGSSAFDGCINLTSVTIESGIKTISGNAFANCPELRAVYCHAEQVPNTSSNAFEGSYPNYITLYVPESSIGSYKSTVPWNGFQSVKSIESDEGTDPDINLSGTVQIDGIYYNLVDKVKTAEVTSNPNKYKGEVVIPSSVVYGASTYSVTSIGGSSFYYCSGLTSVSIPNSVTSIGSSAFSGCSGLTSVTIPNSVKSIGSEAFRCSGLTSVTIPNSVTSIGSSAFSWCSGLTSVTIPNSVASIGGSAFSGCSGLTSVTIPNSVTSIGWDAFLGCSGLTSVTIPNSVTSIGSSAFDGCIKLTSVTIESGIKTISGNAFANCPELRAVYCHAEQVPNTSSNAFESSYISYTTLHVPASAVSSYKVSAPWSGFKNVIAIGSEIVSDARQIYTDDISAGRGRQVMIPIKLNNAKTISALLFDVELPEGVQFVEYEKTARISSHSVSYNQLSGNRLRFLAVSLEDKSIATGNGTVLNLTVSIPESMALGNYDITLANIELNHNESSNVETIIQADATSKLTVVEATTKLGDANGDGKVTVTDVSSTINYILQKTPSNFVFEAADANGDGKITITDVTKIINIVLGKTGSGTVTRGAMRETENEIEPE